jgi:Tol biopolymer transport system component/DNA-binding winged helix-turn-helix (wHTH) protein
MVMSKQAKKLYKFGHFSVDAAERMLLRDGQVVALTPKAFDLLLVLVENRGHLLEKEELMQEIWPETFVEEANLTNNISMLRKALSVDDDQQYIETVRRRGYRFVAEIEEYHDDDMEVIVEEHTRVTFEHQEEISATNGDPRPGAERVIPTRDLRTDASTAPSVHTRPALRRLRAVSAVVVGLLVFATVVVAALLAWFQRSHNEPQKNTSIPLSHNMEIKRVTASGRAKSAAISPDGRYIAYVLDEGDLQSIQLMQVDSSSSVQIRPPAEVGYRWISFTPDGTSLYYAMRETGQPQTLYRSDVLGGVPQKVLTDIDSPFAFSPDGKRLAFMRFYPEGETAVVVADAHDGSAESKLAVRRLPEKFSVNGPSWSPDGRVIAICGTSRANGSRSKVFGIRVEDGKIEPLSDHEWSNGDRVAWLGNGSGLAVIGGHQEVGDRRQIWHLSYPGGEVSRITNDLHEYDGNNLSLSADSQSLVTLQIETTSNIWVLPDGDSARARQLTFGSAGKYDGFYGLSWTPDGRIVYGSYVGNSQSIWVMNADGSNQKQLTPAGYWPMVTGDGRYIVFCSTRSGALEIWRTDLDGGNALQLTQGGNNYLPSVSPDGKWVVYRSLGDELWAIWKVSIDGGTPTRLTDRSANWPSVSPDGKWVACSYDGSVALVPIDGGPPATSFTLPRTATASMGLSWTPTGNELIIRDSVQGVWLQPLSGGEARHLANLSPEKIFHFVWSPEGRQAALVRGNQSLDVVLIRRFR